VARRNPGKNPGLGATLDGEEVGYSSGRIAGSGRFPFQDHLKNDLGSLRDPSTVFAVTGLLQKKDKGTYFNKGLFLDLLWVEGNAVRDRGGSKKSLRAVDL